LRCPRNTLYPQSLALTSPTNGGRSVGIVRLRTTATDFFSLPNKVAVVSPDFENGGHLDKLSNTVFGNCVLIFILAVFPYF
jgi:hypothetical protein